MTVHESMEIAIALSLVAGKKILELYAVQDLGVEMKPDSSPLTLADKAAHDAIVAGLSQTPFPVISEEDNIPEFAERKSWEFFWLVDPLDGTKEFISRNGEFTVNIALMQNQTPRAGVIYVPVSDTLYFSDLSGAYRLENASVSWTESKSAKAIRLPDRSEPKNYTLMASRSHMNAATENWIQEKSKTHPGIQLISAGSSLKFCGLAEGRAHAYPRFGRTMEWDTAAGQAILKAAGGRVITFPEEGEMCYNKDSLFNQDFIAYSSYALK